MKNKESVGPVVDPLYGHEYPLTQNFVKRDVTHWVEEGGTTSDSGGEGRTDEVPCVTKPLQRSDSRFRTVVKHRDLVLGVDNDVKGA